MLIIRRFCDINATLSCSGVALFKAQSLRVAPFRIGSFLALVFRQHSMCFLQCFPPSRRRGGDSPPQLPSFV